MKLKLSDSIFDAKQEFLEKMGYDAKVIAIPYWRVDEIADEFEAFFLQKKQRIHGLDIVWTRKFDYMVLR